jgi:hypothetical protein
LGQIQTSAYFYETNCLFFCDAKAKNGFLPFFSFGGVWLAQACLELLGSIDSPESGTIGTHHYLT